MPELPLYLNALFLLIIGNLRIGRKSVSILILLIWTILVLLAEYVLLYFLGGSSPTYKFLSVPLPLYLVLFLLPFELTATSQNSFLFKTRQLVAWAIVYIVAFHRTSVWIPALANQTESQLARFIYQVLYVVPFEFSLLAPLFIFSKEDSSPLGNWLWFKTSHLREHFRPVLLGLLCYAAVFVLSNMFLIGHSVKILLHTDVIPLAKALMLYSLYMVLTTHFVAIGLSKTVLDRLFGGEKTSMAEAVFFGILFAGLHWYFQPGYIARELVYGIIFSYVYLKTGTLFYGVVLDSLVQVFTP
jgi:hypothetical protein